MKLKNIMLSMAVLTSLNAQQLNFGLSKTDYKNETSEIINSINSGTEDIKNKTNIYFKITSEIETEQDFENQQDYKIEFSKSSNYVKAYEEKKKRDKEEREITKLKKEIKEEIRQLESDVYHSNKNDVHTDEKKLKIIEKGTDSDIEEVNRKITKHMQDLENVISDMQSKEVEEERRVELFKKEANNIDKSLLDMLVEIEKINGKEDLNRLTNAQIDYLKSNDRDFDEVIDDFNREIEMGD